MNFSLVGFFVTIYQASADDDKHLDQTGKTFVKVCFVLLPEGTAAQLTALIHYLLHPQFLSRG